MSIQTPSEEFIKDYEIQGCHKNNGIVSNIYETSNR